MEREDFSLKVKQNSIKREDFIKSNLSFVRQVASRVCKRPLYWENDDELSIALVAFNEAIDNFDKDKGKFYSFAGMIIKRRLIDYFRKEGKHTIISIDDDYDLELETHPYEVQSAVKEYKLSEERQTRKFAIRRYDKILKEFGLSFTSLVKESPKHSDTRIDLITNIKRLCQKKQDLVSETLEKGKISPTKVSRATSLTRKQTKTWKNYILALIIVYSYEELASIRDFLAQTEAGEEQ
ncbi:MAG: sigma-70 family RNA polymerase sigma factor [Clostridia bacterium]